MSEASLRGTLAPLPEYHRRGLIVLTTFSFLSALATSLLWCFITYKLVTYWRERRIERRRNRQNRRNSPNSPTRLQDAPASDFPDLSLGLDAPCSGATGFARLEELDRLAAQQEQAAAEGVPEGNRDEEEEEEKTHNPFPILVYNLLLADLMEAVAYGLSVYWVSADGIFAPSSVCWAQGWLGSTSNLAASLFLTTISVNTFLTVGLGYKPPPWTVYTCIAALWTFDFGVNGAGAIVTSINPAVPGESFFMRANVWCWISSAYDPWRFWAHYLWVIISIVLTIGLYSFVFFTLWRQKRSCRHLPDKRASQASGLESDRGSNQGPRLSGYHPAFLVYPFVYVGCSVPLVVGRITSLLGIDLGIAYFAFAGSVLAANGLFNSILWTSTILFSQPQDVHDTGLDRFAFQRTPIRDYGHTVVISGPYSRRVPLSEIAPTRTRKEWWWWKHGGQRGWGRPYVNSQEIPIVHEREVPGHASPSFGEVPSDGRYIQMDIITAVTVESVDSIQPMGVDRQ
ncbi:integral membrane protein [Colletotrichum musicola]|uniref:Integral membrane protein n=1 Tax=Colletotrichum musicola TaxID=2175873 RepID=A0A8H6N7J3_9PEZI|nr:integral membrane protein [Colletotrichum musicola]